MHVGLIIQKLAGGGAERSVVNLARGLIARGHRVDIVLFEKTIYQQVAEGVRLFIVENTQAPIVLASVAKGLAAPVELAATYRASDWIRLATALKWDPLCLPSSHLVRQARAVASYMESERPDCVLTNLWRGNVATLLAGRLLTQCPPVVPVIRGVVGSGKGRTQRRYRHLFDGAAHFVGVSEGAAENLTTIFGISSERISTIYNPVVTPDLHVKMADDPNHPWLMEDGVPVILAAGRLVEQKDFSTLLKAFARVVERRSCRLVILGEGELQDKLEGLARDFKIDDRVSFPGWVENPFAFMSRASLFVLSSRHEGLPGVLVQALACGCPCVSTDCPAGPAEILENGKFGPLVPVGDEAALAEAMERVFDRPPDRRTLQERADHFSEERSVAAYEELIQAVVRQGGP